MNSEKNSHRLAGHPADGLPSLHINDSQPRRIGHLQTVSGERRTANDRVFGQQHSGIEIGSHTANHDPLTSMDAARQLDEVHLSKLLLEWNGIHTVYTFSYPNGAYDASLPALLAQNEYLTAVTGDAGLNTFETDPYLMQRVNIPHPRFGLLEFKLRLLKAEIFTKLRIHQHLENPS